jgi:Ca2+-binding RTX toxin-like protein
MASDDPLPRHLPGRSLTRTSGRDTLNGAPGNDTLTPGAGADVINGGDGNDTVFARDRVSETIRCGGGVDSVTIDRTDVAIG